MKNIRIIACFIIILGLVINFNYVDAKQLKSEFDEPVFDRLIEDAIESNIEAELKNSYGETYSVKIFEVANSFDKIDDANILNDEFSKTYLISLEDKYIQALSGNNYKEKWDSSLGVKADLTVYYNTKGTTPEEYLLTKVSGGWTIADTSISLSNREVYYVSEGSFPQPVYNQHSTKTPTTNSFNYNTGFTKYVAEDFSLVGATSKVTLKRGTSSTWTLTLPNNIVD